MTQMDGVEKKVGKDTYKILMLDPMTSGDMLIDILDMLGPSAGVIGSGIMNAENSKEALLTLIRGLAEDSSDDDKKASMGVTMADLIGDNFEKVILGLIDRMDKAKIREIITLMRGVTSVKVGNDWPSLDSIFEVHFRGRIIPMYKWVAAAVQVQYGNFS